MVNCFTIADAPLKGVKLIQRNLVGDQRGYLERMFCADEMNSLIAGKNICQINHTFTKTKGTVRGMHFQYPPNMEMKFVQCIRGSILDVVVDLRKNSSTYLNHYSVVLSEQNHQTLLIPEGFAHGLQTLTDDCELIYFHTASYEPGNEGVISIMDPQLSIELPLPITLISDRDISSSITCEQFHGIEL